MKVSISARNLVSLALFFVFVLFPLALSAQNPRGALRGVVEDGSGARVAGAKVSVKELGVSQAREAVSDQRGEFRVEDLSPGSCRVAVKATGFAEATADVQVVISTVVEINVRLRPAPVRQTVNVEGQASSITTHIIDTASNAHQAIVTAKDLETVPLAHRSFANIAYMVPGTEPVEPSDPTKARITAVAFGGSSGLNVDLSVDGGDNNDDYIGGFLQNFSPDAMQEFTVRTAQFDSDTSPTNGGSVIISTKQGTNDWHGGAGVYYRNQNLNARNDLDNPEPSPKQSFSRENGIGAIGGPIIKDKLWFFTALEYVDEDSSV